MMVTVAVEGVAEAEPLSDQNDATTEVTTKTERSVVRVRVPRDRRRIDPPLTTRTPSPGAMRLTDMMPPFYGDRTALVRPFKPAHRSAAITLSEELGLATPPIRLVTRRYPIG